MLLVLYNNKKPYILNQTVGGFISCSLMDDALDHVMKTDATGK